MLLKYMSKGRRAPFAAQVVGNGTATPEAEKREQDRRRKPLIFISSVIVLGLWTTLALVYYCLNSRPFESRRNDDQHDGLAPLWAPPLERPIPLEKFPPLSNSSLLFLHIWKCAGSSLRHLLRDWAIEEGGSIAIVVRCEDIVSSEGKVCLKDHHLINATEQGHFIRENQVLAGHFTWGFQRHVRQPYVMFTTFRNPLELFVSGQQYLNRKSTKHFEDAVAFISSMMNSTVSKLPSGLDRGTLQAGDALMSGLIPESSLDTKSVGYIYRLVDPEILASKSLAEAADEAMANLDTFWFVGVIEQYHGFMAVLRQMMDPANRHATLWERYATGHYNTSPVGSAKILGGIDPDIVSSFNATLGHQWRVYEHALELFRHRCRQVLHVSMFDLCEVPLAASSYEISHEEVEELLHMHEGHYTGFSKHDLAYARVAWAALASKASPRNGSDDHGGTPEEAWRLFSCIGLNMSDTTNAMNLWSRLRLDETFGLHSFPGQPLAEHTENSTIPLSGARHHQEYFDASPDSAACREMLTALDLEATAFRENFRGDSLGEGNTSQLNTNAESKSNAEQGSDELIKGEERVEM